MANNLYRLWSQNIIKTANTDYALDSAEGAAIGVFCALIDTGTYTFAQTHQFLSDLSGIVGTDQEILTKTQALGVFDGTNLTYTAVSGATVEALILYRQTAGADTTDPLILFMDTGVTGLPVTPNGGDITVTWNGSGIFKLSVET